MIYLHLGFAKTATTFLQKHIFCNLKKISFLGRLGAIDSNDEVYLEVCRYCYIKNHSTLENKLRIQKIIEQRLEYGDLLISEEWFTTDYDGFSQGCGNKWQIKIKLLAELLSPFKKTVLLTIREPIEACFSLYVEYQQLRYGRGLYRDFSDFIDGNEALVYNYETSVTLIEKNFDNCKHIKFEELKFSPESFKMKLEVFFGEEIEFVNIKENVKVKDSTGVHIFSANGFFKIALIVWNKLPVVMRSFLSFLRFRKFVYILGHKKAFVSNPTVEQKLVMKKKYKDTYEFMSYK